MRSYLHHPDEAFLRKQLPILARRIGLSEVSIPKALAAGRPGIYDAAVDTAFTLARLQWALDEPVDHVAATMRRTSERVRDALANGYILKPTTVDRWLEIAIIGGDGPTALAIVNKAERVAAAGQRGEVVSAFLAGMRGLLGDRTGAAEAAAALGSSLAAAETSPAIASSFVAMDTLINSTVVGDQDGFDRAAEHRRLAQAATYGASIELRRQASGLLDAAGAAVARLALVHDLRVDETDPYLATELLRALPWREP